MGGSGRKERHKVMKFMEFLGIPHGGWVSLGILVLFGALLYGLSHLPKKKYSFAVRVLMGSGAGTFFGLVLHLAADPGVLEDLKHWFYLAVRGYVMLFVCLIMPMVLLASICLVLRTPVEKQVSALTRWKKRVNTLMVAVSASIASCLGIACKIGQIPGSDSAVFAWNMADTETVPELLFRLIPSGIGHDLITCSVTAALITGIYIGIAARRMSGKYMDTVKPVIDFVNGAFSVGTSVCKTVIAYKPAAAAAIMSYLTAEYGFSIVLMLIHMLLVLCLGAALMLTVQLVLCAVSGVGPAAFLRAGRAVMIKALKTRSGSECLPDAQKALSEGLGLKKEITDVVSSYAIASGMQGCGALFPAMAAVFAAGISGYVMTPATVFLLVLVISVMSYGITGLPGTATMAEFAAVMGCGLTDAVTGLGAMIAIDPIGDVPRTLINVTGCMTNAIIVERRVRS